jgi:predicted aconitase
MKLTADEQAMLDGSRGKARQKAMDLLLRYGEALGAERFVDTNNVCGTVGASTPFLREYGRAHGGMDAVFSEFNLDSAEVVEIPRVAVRSSHLQQGIDPDHAERQGIPVEVVQLHRKGEAYTAGLGVQMLNTCAPYTVGNVPARGEHCAWMESSAVIYINSVLGARTNAEGRESAGCAMLTGKIPYWGYHIEKNRFGTHHVSLEIDVESTADWGLLGYYIGEVVQERVPVVSGVRQAARCRTPEAFRRRRGLLGWRRDVPPGWHHAGSADSGGGFRPQSAGGQPELRQGGTAPGLRTRQRDGEEPGRGFRHAGLPALHAGTDCRAMRTA